MSTQYRRIRLIQRLLLQQQLHGPPCGSLCAHSIATLKWPAASNPSVYAHIQGSPQQQQQTQQQQQQQHEYLGPGSGDSSNIYARAPATTSIVLSPPAWSTAQQLRDSYDGVTFHPHSKLQHPSAQQAFYGCCSDGSHTHYREPPSRHSSSSSRLRRQRSWLGESPSLGGVGFGVLNHLASNSPCRMFDLVPSSIPWLRHRHKNSSMHGVQTFSTSSSSSNSNSNSSSSACDTNLELLVKNVASPFGTASTADSSNPQPSHTPGGLSTVEDGSCCRSDATDSSSMLISALGSDDLTAASAAEPHTVISIFREAATAMQWIHDASGLPWWASIPLTTLTLRLALMPVSMWQAKMIRTNYMVYREAAAMADRELLLESRDKPRAAPSSGSSSSSSSSSNKDNSPQEPASAAERVRRGKLVLSNFTFLRSKLEAPHPAWIVVNPLIQVPVFVITGMTLRMIGGFGWPGLKTEGALWFPDLTQVAMVSSYTEQGALALDFPMGPAGFMLPLAIFAATLTSLRIGFGAAGARAAPADDWVGQVLKVLPPLLYGMTFINLWVKLQLPHCALLHWAASSAFTLGLQVSLQQPAFRSAFNLPSPKDMQELLGRLSGQQLQELEDASRSLAANTRGYVVSALPEKLVKQVLEETSADVLVVLGAQHSAQRRYREALYCLDRALQMEPGHVRAHYSRGQVFSLSGRWLDAQACFERAAELAPAGSTEKGQAIYCIATAMHTQGNLEGATQAYQQAAELWPNQPVISFSLANVLLAQRRLHEARKVVEEALGMAAMRNPRAPFRQQFAQLLERIDHALAPVSQQT